MAAKRIQVLNNIVFAGRWMKRSIRNWRFWRERRGMSSYLSQKEQMTKENAKLGKQHDPASPLSGSAVIVELSMARKGWTSWIGKLATLLFLSKAAQIRGYTLAAISPR